MTEKEDFYPGYQVTETIERAHPRVPYYDLLEGDLIVQESGGTWYKMAPGLALNGFVLTPEQEQTLKPVRYASDDLSFVVEPRED